MLARIGTALLSGDDNAIERMVASAVDRAGERLLREVILRPVLPSVAVQNRMARAIETGGASELERQARRWINAIRPSAAPLGRLGQQLDAILTGRFNQVRRRGRRRGPRWARSNWATSHQQWVTEGWLHDWRSQPRNPAGYPAPRIVGQGKDTAAGEWIPGRLGYPVAGASMRGGKTVSPRRKAIRKKHLRYRRIGRETARGFLSSWAND